MKRFLRAAVLVALSTCVVFGAVPAATAFYPKPLDRYSAITTWPQHDGAALLGNPRACAYDASGNLYVADDRHSRILKIDPSGSVWVIASKGSGNGHVNYPSGIAVRDFWGTEELYVVDAGNNRIQVLGLDGSYLRKFGSYGSGMGQFSGPAGIAFDPTDPAHDYFWIADSGNGRVQKWRAIDDQFLASYGSEGSDPGEFKVPQGVAVDSSGAVYVADTYNHRIQKLNSAGEFQWSHGSYGYGSEQYAYPYGVGLDASGATVYATDARPLIHVLSTAGVELRTFGTYNPLGSGLIAPYDVVAFGGLLAIPEYGGMTFYRSSDEGFDHKWNTNRDDVTGFHSPMGACMAGNSLWVADSYNNRVVKLNTTSGLSYSSETTTFDSGQTFSTPSDVAVDDDGRLYVADLNNHRVVVFNADGTFSRYFGNADLPSGIQIQYAEGIGIRGDNLYVCDASNDRVFQFSISSGTLIDYFTGPDRPLDVAERSDGLVCVSEGRGHTVSVYDPATGKKLDDFGTYGYGEAEFAYPDGITIDAQDRVLVCDSESDRVQKFDEHGVYLGVLGVPGSFIGELDEPCGVAVGGDGTAYVIEKGTSRISVWRPAYQTHINGFANVSTVGYNGATDVLFSVNDADGEAVEDLSVEVQRSYDGKTWSTWKTLSTGGDGVASTSTGGITTKTYYRARFLGGAGYKASTGSSFAVTPKASVSNPVAPSSVKKSKAFTVYGYLSPKHTAGASSVLIRKYRKEGGVWKYKGSLSAKNYTSGSKTKYVASVKLTSTGSWALRAYAPADSGHAATYSSGYDYVTVK